MTDAPSFPRLYARTLRFTLGTPRNLRVTPDGERVLFLRTPSGTSRAGALWSYDVADAKERLIADPEALLGNAGEELSAEERARRERSRETASGIVGYTTDAEARVAAFALSGAIWVADVAGEGARRLPSNGSVIDPHVDPTGSRVAYASDGALRVIGTDGEGDRSLVESDDDDVVWAQAEFVAAEEMERYRGFWWAPDGASLLVERYDNSAVPVWYVADPANPDVEPVAHRYPAAGSTNADVSLWHVSLDGTRRRIEWDAAYPYLTRVSWSSFGSPLIQVMSRDQRSAQIRRIDIASGQTTLVRELHDDIWLDLYTGAPAYAPDGRLVTVEPDSDTNRVALDGDAISPVGLQVRSVLGVDDRGVLVTANDDPTELHLVRVGLDGSVTRLTAGGGLHSGSASGPTMVVVRSALDLDASTVTVYREGAEVGQIANLAEDPGFKPVVSALTVGDRGLHTAVVFPRDHTRGSQQLPVLLDPYGGPHALRNVKSSRAFLLPQWLADQGFCVVVSDGRGTPGRGPAWDRAIRDDFVGATLDDQVDALAGVAHAYPNDIDTGRVAMTGWSYGGYLSALAVLRRPDVFHAGVAGAPVTDWRLYDTFYTERYLGHPDEQPEVYDRNSLSELAGGLERPLMIIHGLVDDNVVVAHSLRLSSALLAAGKPHEVLPLTGVTHMTPQEKVAENLQLLQVEFIRRSLGVG